MQRFARSYSLTAVLLFLPIDCLAGVVTVDFSGQSLVDTFSGQIQYDLATANCGFDGLCTLAGPVTLTISDLSGLTFTSASNTPKARLFTSVTLSGQETAILSFSPSGDPGFAFDVTGPNGQFIEPHVLTFIFTLPQLDANSSLSPPVQLPDLTASQSLSIEADYSFAIFRDQFGGNASTLSFASGVPEPSALKLILVGSLFLIAIFRLRATSSIL